MKAGLDILFKPTKIGSIDVKNRFAVAAMTRMRCAPDGVPNDLLVEFYKQRASSGFMLTECSPISVRSGAFPGAGGIHTDAQVDGWKKVTDAVHQAGGKIIIQLWHAGRAAHSTLQNGLKTIGPSPIAIRGKQHAGPQEVPEEMTKLDIQNVVQEFFAAAVRAKLANFDGVELHGANGYIIDQFLRTSANKRTDEYGGSVENRARLALEVIDSLIQVWGADKVGIKVSPIGRYNDMNDEDPVKLYSHLFRELDKRKIAFIELSNNDDPENHEEYGYPASRKQVPDLQQQLRPHFKGVIVGNCGIAPEDAATQIGQGLYEIASYAQLYIQNPDLVERVKNGWPTPKPTSWDKIYRGGAAGYTDYPFHQS